MRVSHLNTTADLQSYHWDVDAFHSHTILDDQLQALSCTQELRVQLAHQRHCHIGCLNMCLYLRLRTLYYLNGIGGMSNPGPNRSGGRKDTHLYVLVVLQSLGCVDVAVMQFFSAKQHLHVGSARDWLGSLRMLALNITQRSGHGDANTICTKRNGMQCRDTAATARLLITQARAELVQASATLK